MQIAGHHRHKWDGNLESLKLRWEKREADGKQDARSVPTPEQATAQSKNHFAKAMGAGVTVVTITRAEAERRRLAAVAAGASETI